MSRVTRTNVRRSRRRGPQVSPRRSRAIALALLVLGGSSLVAPAPARADIGAVDAAAREAATHFDRGVKLYDEQDWRAALIEFERAYALLPHFRVLFDIGQCRYQLRDYVGALGAFQKYLAQGGTELPPARRDQAQSAVDELRGRVAHLRVTADVDGAEITVDDAVVGTTPLAAPLLVGTGRRKIAASKPGRVSAVRVIDVAGDDAVDVAFRLPPAASPDSKTLDGRATPGRPVALAIVSFAFAAAGAGVGTVFGVLAMDDKRQLDRACVAKMCPASSQSVIDDSQRNATIATIGVAAAAVGLVGGLSVLLLTSGGASGSRAGLGVRPFIGLGSAGAAGTF